MNFFHAFYAANLAREKLGDVHQDRMIVEECGELITALAQRDRGRVSQSHVNEEIADVLLTCFGALSPEVWLFLEMKTERLLQTLNEMEKKE